VTFRFLSGILPERKPQGRDKMIIERRQLLGAVALAPLLSLPGCAGTGGFSLVEAIRRLLSLSSQRADAGKWFFR
jgi:hypothetical protein